MYGMDINPCLHRLHRWFFVFTQVVFPRKKIANSAILHIPTYTFLKLK